VEAKTLAGHRKAESIRKFAVLPYMHFSLSRCLDSQRLPFMDAMPGEKVEQIGQMDFITFAPVLEPLVRELGKRAAERELSPKLRELLPRVMNGLLVKGWTENENWGFPRAIDRKLAARIESLLGRA